MGVGVASGVGDGDGLSVAEGLGVGVGVDGAGGAGAGPPPPPEACGVTALEAEEATEEPAAFVATTVNEYAVPFARPEIVHDVVATEQVAPPGDAVAV